MFQFVSTHPAVATMLLLTLATTLTITLGHEETEAVFKHLGRGKTYKYIQSSPTEKFYPSQTVMECAMRSSYSDSQFFTYHKVSRLCKNYSTGSKVTMSTTEDSNEISFYRGNTACDMFTRNMRDESKQPKVIFLNQSLEEWMKVYFLSAGAGSNVYRSFLNQGNPSSWNVDKCKDNICPNFFRHPLLDAWKSLQIYEVKLVLYENETAVINMVFNGQNTTKYNWYSIKNLKSSPWHDLNQNTAEEFSIYGNGLEIPEDSHMFSFNNWLRMMFIPVSSYNRFFFIGGYRQCNTDFGWFIALHRKYGCKYEEAEYPAFYYANTKSKVIWNDGHGKADSMAIFLRLK